MKLSLFLFALLVGMCLVIAFALVTEEVPDGHGFPHPDYPTMQRGGDGAARFEGVGGVAWALGVMELLFFVGLLAFGARKKTRFSTEEKLLLVGAGLFAAVFTWLIVAYRSFAADSTATLTLSFPVPTAIMLYGVGFMPLFFVLLYLLRFRPWILDDDDLSEFLARAEKAKEG